MRHYHVNSVFQELQGGILRRREGRESRGILSSSSAALACSHQYILAVKKSESDFDTETVIDILSKNMFLHAFLKQHCDIMEGYKRRVHSPEENKDTQSLKEKTTQVQVKKARSEDIERKSENG